MRARVPAIALAGLLLHLATVGVSAGADVAAGTITLQRPSESDTESRTTTYTNADASGAASPHTADLVVTVNAEVRTFLYRFTHGDRDLVSLWLNRSGRHLTMIRETFARFALPEDLAFTAMIESGFNPAAVSRAGAAGLWQFMVVTARLYGLRVDEWVDERFDPEKSTVAAARYLADLYRQFGSWPLAQAAYNAGDGSLSRAIHGAGSRDFWRLARTSWLPRETKNYVPQIQAVTLIGRDPTRFGFEVPPPYDPVTERVAVPPGTPLARLSKEASIDADVLASLNRPLVRGVTPPRAAYDLAVPPGTRERVVRALATMAERDAATARAAAWRRSAIRVSAPDGARAQARARH